MRPLKPVLSPGTFKPMLSPKSHPDSQIPQVCKPHLKGLDMQLIAQGAQLFLAVGYAFDKPFLQALLFSNHHIQEILQDRKQSTGLGHQLGGKNDNHYSAFYLFESDYSRYQGIAT